MNKINRQQAESIIDNTNGRVFSVIFTKKNGERRVMNCRLGVKKYTNGKGMKYNPSKRGYKVVYEMNNRGYRMINLNTLEKIKANGQEFELV